MLLLEIRLIWVKIKEILYIYKNYYLYAEHKIYMINICSEGKLLHTKANKSKATKVIELDIDSIPHNLSTYKFENSSAKRSVTNILAG